MSGDLISKSSAPMVWLSVNRLNCFVSTPVSGMICFNMVEVVQYGQKRYLILSTLIANPDTINGSIVKEASVE